MGAAVAIGLVASWSPSAGAASFEVGEPARRLELEDRAGRAIAADATSGRVVVVDLWASWCVPCRPALETLEGLAKRYATDGVVVLAVSADRDRDDAEAFIDERFPDSPITFAYDPGRALIAGSGAGGLPATFLIDREGIVRYAESGWSPAKAVALEREIARLLGRLRKSLARERLREE